MVKVKKKGIRLRKAEPQSDGVVIDFKIFYYLGAIVGTIEGTTAQIPYW